MKKIILSIVAIAGIAMIFSQFLAAQENSQSEVCRNLFYTELFGPGVFMSANFDSRFNSNERLGFGYRIGLGFGYGKVFEGINNYGYDNYVSRTYYSIPAGLNYVLGKPGSHQTLEVGAGFTILTRKQKLYTYNYDDKSGRMLGFFTFMYRIMPEEGGFSFRVGLTPIIGTAGDLLPSGAISFGYVF